MPTLGVFADDLCRSLDIKYSDQDKEIKQKSEKEFNSLCFAYGLELDEVTCEYEMVEKEKGVEAAEKARKEAAEKGKDTMRTIWKVDIPANRYDLLCLEGLTRSLQCYRGQMEPVQYTLKRPQKPLQCFVKKEVAQVRPYFVMAVLRNIKFTQASYESFIDLQDKLHQNIGRRRELVSMGTHDLDKLEGPFTYEALPAKDINFIPLKDPHDVAKDGTESYDAKTLLTGYQAHPQLRAYVPLIYEKERYPVIYDSNRTVCSMPPIINSWHSRITLDTRNVLLDVTGLDYTKCNIVLDQLCAMFSCHCDTPFEVEQVEMIIENDYPSGVPFIKPGSKKFYPTMEEKTFEASVPEMKDWLELQHLSTPEVQKCLTKMMLPSEASADGDKLQVRVPCTRPDIMHEVDLIEDLAISYGYNNLKARVPEVIAEIKDQKIGRLTDMLRYEFAGAGYSEGLTFVLCSRDDCFKWMRREASAAVLKSQPPVHSYEPKLPAVVLRNAKTKEYNTVRTSLIPGLLKMLNYNRKNPLPLRLFEVADVAVQDLREETGSRNQRRAAAIMCNRTSSFEDIHGLLDHIMYKLKVRSKVEVKEMEARNAALPAGTKAKRWKGKVYELVHADEPEFLPGMCGHILVDGLRIGVAGVLRPDVLDPPAEYVGEGENRARVTAPWSVKSPCSVVELNIEPFLKSLKE
ncbi:unnamed protein product [Amoebophrya sp. A25]|nr:unnamed protein product [Amoebophrya sp. A25]|eukprot:GSA25T00001916001.1